MNKEMALQELVGELRDGMTIGIGGWGPRRKPMALIREILKSDLKDLTIVAYGGADVGMLCAAGKVKKVVFAFVSLDFIPLEPYFRQARQNGEIEVMEIDEGMLLLGLRAAAWGCSSPRTRRPLIHAARTPPTRSASRATTSCPGSPPSPRGCTRTARRWRSSSPTTARSAGWTPSRAASC